MAIRGATRGWIVFLACVLLLSLAGTPYSRTADLALVTLRFSIVIALSVLVAKQRWKHRDDHNFPGVSRRRDYGEKLLERCRRWYYGDHGREKPGR